MFASIARFYYRARCYLCAHCKVVALGATVALVALMVALSRLLQSLQALRTRRLIRASDSCRVLIVVVIVSALERLVLPCVASVASDNVRRSTARIANVPLARTIFRRTCAAHKGRQRF